MAHEINVKPFHVPRTPLLALFFFITVFLAIGCSTETEMKGGPIPEPEPEEEPLPEPELEDGPVPFEVLRRGPSGTQDVITCSFKSGIPDSNSANQEGLSKLELVIDNQVDFENHISCEDSVIINFEEEFVLAGTSKSQPVWIRLKDLTADLTNDSLFVRIGILNGHSTIPSRAEYIIKVTSRDYANYPVIFDVHWIQ